MKTPHRAYAPGGVGLEGRRAGSRQTVGDARRAGVYREDVAYQGVDVVMRTPEQIAELVERIRVMRAQDPHVTQAQMGAELEVSTAYVSHLMRKNGIPGRGTYGGTGAVPVGQSKGERLARLDAWEKEHGPYRGV